jgi:hypothetical protein
MEHNDVLPFAVSVFASGSRVICNPPPMNTDADYVVLARDTWCAFDIMDHLELRGYSTTSGRDEYADMGDFDNGEGFMSFKKGEINYIITTSAKMYDSFVVATSEAKSLNLMNKEDRVALFRKHLYGEEN